MNKIEYASNNTPLISVLLPVYNAGVGVLKTLESIKNQTYTNFEVIVVNDGSTDNCIDLIPKKFPEAFVVHQENQGLTNALNNGLRYCKGKYIARIDCFDIALPSRFQKQIDMLEKYATLGAIGGHVVLYEANGREIGLFKYPLGIKDTRDAIYQVLPVLSHSAAMIRKSKLVEIGGYDPFYNGREDFELWTRLALVSDLDNVDSVIMKTLNTAKGITFNATDLSPLTDLALYEFKHRKKHGVFWKDIIARESFLKKIKSKPRTKGNPNRNRSIFYCKRAGAIYRSGDRKNALKQYYIAIKADFTYYRPWLGLVSALFIHSALYVKHISFLKKVFGKKYYN